MSAHRVTLIPGDWIGPETCQVVQEVIDAAGVSIQWDEFSDCGTTLSASLLESCRSNGTVLKARMDTGREIGRLPPTVQLRKELGLWATVRPVQALPWVPAKFPGLDLLVIRETSEDIYSGFEHEVTDGVYEAVKVTTLAACERIARFGFDMARRKGREKVTIVHKSNIMKKSDGMFLRVAQEVATSYPDIEVEEVIVDALCMRLVKNPHHFDVLLTLNLFGDIVSDLCSGLAGGITASPSASYGRGIALFENPHGKAPSLVGTGRANPIPMLRAGIMMLDHLKEQRAAARIGQALLELGKKGLKTIECGGDDGCVVVRDAVVAELNR